MAANNSYPVAQASPQLYSTSPSRSLLITSVHYSDEVDLWKTLDAYGDIRALQTDTLPYGFIIVHYYNLKHAETAFSAIRNFYLQQCRSLFPPPCWVYYVVDVPDFHSLPISDPQNLGTIIVFNLDESISSHTLQQIFEHYGPVKECRFIPRKLSHRFVEFYDVRDAARALEQMNGKEIAGRTVFIQYSRRGGQGKNFINGICAPEPVVNNFRPSRSTYGNQESMNDYSQFPIKDDGDSGSSSRDSRTTLMIKNIPNKYRLASFSNT